MEESSMFHLHFHQPILPDALGKLFSGAQTAGAFDIGLYRTTADAGAVVNAAFFASAVSLNGGALSKSDVTLESTVVSVANAAKPVWENLSLTSDPSVDYDVTLTLTGAADATGTALIEVEYVI